MLTRNVSLIEGLLNDEKKLLQFLDGKYRQYKDYNDCKLATSETNPTIRFTVPLKHRFTWVPPTTSSFRISKTAEPTGIFLPFVGTTFRQSNSFFPNIRRFRRTIWRNFCRSTTFRRNSASPLCPLLSIRSGMMRC